MPVCVNLLSQVFRHFHQLHIQRCFICQAFAAAKSFFHQFRNKHTYLPCKYAWHISPSEDVVRGVFPDELEEKMKILFFSNMM
jgi:hypothetical protein